MSALRYTRRAREDLLEIWAYIAPHNMAAADRVFDLIAERCKGLRDFPELGPARPNIAADARALVIEHWIALYRLIEDGVQIVRIVDGVQDLTKLEWVDAP